MRGEEFAARWTPRTIKRECSPCHSRYVRSLQNRYVAYFGSRPEFGSSHPYVAKDIASALPPGHECLGESVPPSARHGHFLSGGSSQTLAVALLGSAMKRDPGLGWFRRLLNLPPLGEEPEPTTAFEYALTPDTLNETPHVTNIDLLLRGGDVLLCVEAKLWEAGLGSCSCGKEKVPVPTNEPSEEATPAQERAACSARVLDRPAYWSAAREVFGLPPRAEGKPCPIAASYQGVRNVAAARALADKREPAFALFYDARNPYFSGSGNWPGWPTALTDMITDKSEFIFRSCSWQRLLGSGAVPDDVVRWAEEKHGLS